MNGIVPEKHPEGIKVKPILFKKTRNGVGNDCCSLFYLKETYNEYPLLVKRMKQSKTTIPKFLNYLPIKTWMRV